MRHVLCAITLKEPQSGASQRAGRARRVSVKSVDGFVLRDTAKRCGSHFGLFFEDP